MKILALDQSLASSGYCLMDIDENIIDVGLIKTNNKKENKERLLEIYNKVQELTDKHNPDVIVIEESYFRTNIKTLKTLNMVRGVIELIAAQNNMPISIKSTTECRKIVFDNGNTKKEEVYEYITNLYKDIKFINTDMTDATLIALAYIKNKKEAGVNDVNGKTQTTRKLDRNRKTSYKI